MAHPVEPLAILSIQPRPLQTLRASLTGRDGASYIMLIRRWSAADAGRCQLCSLCTAKVGPDRQAVCIVAADLEGPAPPHGTVDRRPPNPGV